MRFVISVLLLVCLCPAKAFCTVKDSLLQILQEETRPAERCVIYRNLSDLGYDTPDEAKYLQLLIQEAELAGFNEMLPEAMGNIAMAYIVNNQFDSAAYYVERLGKLEKTEEVRSWETFLDMFRFNRTVVASGGTQVIEETRKKLENGQDGDIYSRIRDAYVVANGLYSGGRLDQAMGYAVTAEQLAATLPFKTGNNIHLYTVRLMAWILIRDQQFTEGIRWTEKYIELLEKYYEQYYKAVRPYYYINSLRISAYSMLMINILAMPEEKADYYFRKVAEYNATAVNIPDKYACSHIMYNYYVAKRDFPRALSINDSLMAYSRIIAPYNLAGLYRISSILYEYMENYEEALKALKVHYSLQDSLNLQKSDEHLNRLQVEYDVNKLNYEKSQLEVKNKKNILLLLSLILALLAGLCVYLYRSLRKERMMKLRLAELNIKAEESEKMKTLFIRSVCHEIRTPLNAIVGFSELLCTSDIDEEMRQSFPEEIQKNSMLLISLVSRMLEVSELDVSNEKLPLELTDIHVVCMQSMERLKHKEKEGISYLLDVPDEPLMMQTNEHYLMSVIENLLDNANKFTESGSIALHYEVDREKHRVRISITDTGCGVPADMYEKVFERFSKLDSYRPGNGLGLYICRLIVKRLAGTIYIDPGYTEGTRIWVELPLA